MFTIIILGTIIALIPTSIYAQTSLPDEIRPEVRITNPPTPTTITNHVGTIVIQGTASDEGGIAKVEAFAHTLPHDGRFNFQPAIPASPGDWSEWSIELTIPDDQTHRILVRATDNTGNVNWAETTINEPSEIIPDVVPEVIPEVIPDSTQPQVRITNPPTPATITNQVGTIVIQGTASDEGGIVKVEGFAHTLPFDDNFNFQPAIPASPGDWSKWSIELTIPDDQTYRVLVRATDKTGNVNWAETTINAPPEVIPEAIPEIIPDSTQPQVRITNPSTPTTITNHVGTIVIQGTASDENGIAKVEGFAHLLPFDNNFNFQPAISASTGDWSEWSIELTIPDDQTHRILVRATDNTGNVNWAETIINAPSEIIPGVTPDEIRPKVSIFSPSSPFEVTNHIGEIIIEGTASDESGISKVEAFAHTLPFNDNFNFQPAISAIPGDWSKWSIKITIPDDQPYRVVVRATDNTGNVNWADTTINGQFDVIPDSVRPDIKITNPSTICTPSDHIGDIIIEGISSDENGITKIEGFAHTLPFDDNFNFQPAIPASPGDWSKWSIELTIQDDQPYRIVVRATDNTGNVNWDNLLVNSPFTPEPIDNSDEEQKKTKHAFLYYTFTDGAYNLDSFYFFYGKYHDASPSKKITTDLDLLTGDVPYDYSVDFFRPLVDKVEEFDPDSSVSIIRDQDVHDGLIFTKNGSNNFDTIFVLHDEYVTQESYDNLRQFVKNGGVIVFLSSNIFYGEVTYDKKECTVTLVKGHDWEFDGKVAKKSVSERYLEENTQWMGSNFIINDLETKVNFGNNPFEYSHFEENQVTNKDAKILLDYDASFPDSESNDTPFSLGGSISDKDTGKGPLVATYELEYGKGKVIMMGIYAELLSQNTEFLNFFDQIILPRSVGDIYTVSEEGEKFDIFWNIHNGNVTNIQLDKNEKSLNIDVKINDQDKSELEENILIITIPKSLIDAPTEARQAEFTIFVNGKETEYSQASDDIERSIKIPLSIDSSKIKILGTKILIENQQTHQNIQQNDSNLPETNGDNSNGGGCLIATATYGSELSSQVQLLREIRDDKVMSTEAGALFMGGFNKFYYSFSPVVADYERENPVFKEMVKIGITPLLTTLAIMNNAETEQEIITYGVGVLLMNAGLYFVLPAIIIYNLKNNFSRVMKLKT